MKTPIPMTLDDLEATAKDAKNGVAIWGPKYLKIYWDDATNNFTYWYKSNSITRMMAQNYLIEIKHAANS